MKTVSVTDFRNDMKYFLDLAEQERVIIHRGGKKSFAIVPLGQIEDIPYDTAFLEKILQGDKDIAQGKVKKITLDDIWK